MKEENTHLESRKSIQNFVNSSTLLMLATVLALVIANTPWRDYYFSFWELPVVVQLGDFNLLSHAGAPMSVMAFINDALMVLFFFTIGLEIKREFLMGELSSVSQSLLPIVAAVGGMIVPVAMFFLLGRNADYLQGAAIPMATDIAFLLGVLSLLGRRVLLALKIFLTALAVVDDIGGILVIALFYTEHLQLWYILSALFVLVVIWAAGRMKVENHLFYLIMGGIVWYLFLHSGIHPTIAGVLIAFCIPATSLLPDLEETLQPVVNYLVIPLFAFANAGIYLGDFSFTAFTGGVGLTVALSLVIGKFVGIFLFAWLLIHTGLSKLPAGTTWGMMAGASLLCGIGFTVALFIANLSYGQGNPRMLSYLEEAKVGIVIASLIAGLLGYLVLHLVTPSQKR